MRTDIIIHVIHVSGLRMIAQGTDGLSRGDKSTGSMLGSPVRLFAPLHLNALERSENMKQWTIDMASALDAHMMTPEDWFDGTRTRRKAYIWTPAPAAADVVVDQLAFA